MPGEPIRIVDDECNREFWLVAPESVPALWAEHVRAEIHLGLDAISRGEIVAWNPEAMKELARRTSRESAGNG